MPRESTRNNRIDLDNAIIVLQEVASFVNNNNIKLWKPLEDFFEDIKKKTKNKNNIKIDRAARVSIILENFIKAHNIYINNKTAYRQLLKDLDRVPSGNAQDVHIAYQKAMHEIYSFLENVQYRDFMDAKLYLLNEEQKQKILNVLEPLKESLSNTGPSFAKTYAISSIVNLIASLETSIIKYSVSYQLLYPNVYKEEKGEHYIEKERGMALARLNQEHASLVNAGNHDALTIAKKESEKRAKEQKINDNYKYLMENREKLDIRLIGFKNASLYPQLHIVKEQKGKQYLHLKSTVPNLMWYKPQLLQGEFKIKEFIENSENAFGNIYFREKN